MPIRIKESNMPAMLVLTGVIMLIMGFASDDNPWWMLPVGFFNTIGGIIIILNRRDN